MKNEIESKIGKYLKTMKIFLILQSILGIFSIIWLIVESNLIKNQTSSPISGLPNMNYRNSYKSINSPSFDYFFILLFNFLFTISGLLGYFGYKHYKIILIVSQVIFSCIQSIIGTIYNIKLIVDGNKDLVVYTTASFYGIFIGTFGLFLLQTLWFEQDESPEIPLAESLIQNNN